MRRNSKVDESEESIGLSSFMGVIIIIMLGIWTYEFAVDSNYKVRQIELVYKLD